MNKEKLKDIIPDELIDYIDLPFILAEKDFADEDDLREYCLKCIRENSEIIYYINAIHYLSENDPSLYESLGLASEYGLTLGQINSETLASLHLQNELTNMLYDLDLSQVFDDE